jgi:peptide/nickel transport system substrate-binding protein
MRKSAPRATTSRALFAVVVVALMLASLGTAASAGVTAAKGRPQGGTINYLAQGEVTSLDSITFPSQMSPPATGLRGYAIYDALIADDFNAGKVVMRIAKSLKSTDSTTWTLTLRDGVKFSDGTPYNAEAVKFNWDRVANAANRSGCLTAAQTIADSTVVDPLTLKITLKAANADFPYFVANTSCLTFLGSPTAINQKGAGFGAAPVGAGAFIVKEWVRDSVLTLVPNPTFYGKRAYVDQVNIRPTSDEAQRMNTLVSGGADMMFTSNVSLNQRATDAGLKITNGAGNGGLNIIFNFDKAPFNDPRARQAVAMAFDTNALTTAVYNGATPGVRTIFKEESPFYDKTLTQAKYNRKKAQALFDQLAAEGKPVQASFIYITSLKPQAEWFQATMASYKNVDIRLDLVADAALAPTLASSAFQGGFYSFFFTNPNPGLLDAVQTGGARNFMHYSNPQVDAAVRKAAQSLQLSEQVQLYKTAQRQILKDVPFIIYARQNNQTFYSKKLQGVDDYLWLGLPRFEQISIRSS